MNLYKNRFSTLNKDKKVTEALLLQQQFYNDSAELARSLVIKMVSLSNDINKKIILKGGSVPNNVSEQSYYVRMGGEYLPEDTPVQVLSLDDNTMINFDTPTLDLHPFTRNHYKYRSKAYEELVLHNQKHETTLKSAALGVSLTEFVDAEDLTIVGWNTELLYPNEIDLIPALNRWIRLTMRRWNIPSYELTEEYYNTSMFLILQMNICLTIMTLRESFKTSNEAHMYFIQTNLMQYGLHLDDINNLPWETKLYLHRNIARLKRTCGKDEVFLELIDNLLTKNNIYVASSALNEVIQVNPDTGYIDYILRHKPLVNSPLQPLTHSVDDTILELGIDAGDVNPFDQVAFDEDWSITTHNIQPLQEIYTDPLLTVDRGNQNKNDFIIDQWVAGASNGEFNYEVDIELPNDVVITLTVLEAFMFWVYLKHLIEGTVIQRIPSWLSNYYLPYDDYVYTDLVAMGTLGGIDISVIDTIWADRPVRGSYENIDQFQTQTERNFLWLKLMEQVSLSQQGLTRATGYKAMVNYFHGEKAIPMGDRAYYSAWLTTKNLNTLPNSNNELRLLADQVAYKAIGYKVSVDEELLTKRSLLSVMGAFLPYSSNLSMSNLDRPINLGIDAILTDITLTTL